MTDRPAAASLIPYETAAPLDEVELAEPPVPLEVAVPMEVGVLVCPQLNFPWIALPIPDSAWNTLHPAVISSVDWTLKPPLTLLSFGISGLND